MNTNTIDLTTIRGAFAYLDSLDRDEHVRLSGPGECNAAGAAVERVTGQPVSAWIERWDGKTYWRAEFLRRVLHSHLRQRLAQRMSSRRWPLGLMINGEPVGRRLGVSHVVVIYNPANDGGLARFVSAVTVACGDSMRHLTKLLIEHAGSCPADVMEYLAALLNSGFGTTWPNGLRVEFDPTRLTIDLKLDVTDDGTWRLVDRVLNYQKTNSQ